MRGIGMTRFTLVASVIVGMLALGTDRSMGDSIDMGFDLFVTDAGTTALDLSASINAGTLGGIPGAIPLQGSAFGPFAIDTVVVRGASGPLDVGQSAEIPILLIGLSLISVDPIPFGTGFADLRVESGSLLNDPGSDFFRDLNIPGSPSGLMQINHTSAGGGTFDSVLPVRARLRLTEVGNPGNVFLEDVIDDVLTASGVWAHDFAMSVNPGLSGGFYAGVDPTTGEKVLTVDESALATHGVIPAMVPLPAAAWMGMMLLGGMGVVAKMRQRRHAA